MKPKFNLYETLGLLPGATAGEIKTAVRKRSKETHPDLAGDSKRDEFEAVTLAGEVLLDPERRRIYDETGEVVTEAPDNDRVAAIAVIQQHMAAIFNDWMGKDFAAVPLHDIRKRDVLADIRHRITADINTATDSIGRGERHIRMLEDVGQRFTTSAEQNSFADGFKIQVDNARKTLEGLQESIRVRQIALVVLGEFRYRKDDVWGGFSGDDYFDRPAMPSPRKQLR